MAAQEAIYNSIPCGSSGQIPAPVVNICTLPFCASFRSVQNGRVRHASTQPWKYEIQEIFIESLGKQREKQFFLLSKNT